jgi:glucan phosphoethanolaminetransferase (alkaline phosphatase superfamily)
VTALPGKGRACGGQAPEKSQHRNYRHCSTDLFPKAVSIIPMIGTMRLIINILLFVLGAVGSGICAFLLSAALADSGLLGSCFEGNCAYAALFMVLPVAWFILFALYVMALLVWRRKPFRNGRF